MPLFDYTGQLQSGSAFEGTLEADTHEHAEQILTDMGIRTVSLRPARRMAYVSPLSLDDFQFFNEQIAALTKSGVPLEEGLRNLAADVGSRKLKRLLLDVAHDLSSGLPLEQALAKQRQRFPMDYPGVVAAGLQTGDLPGTLVGLSAHLRLKGTTRRALLELAAYPFVILAISLAIMSFLMRTVIPQVELIVMDMQGTYVPTYSMSGSAATPPAKTVLSGLLFGIAHAWPLIEMIAIVLLVLFVVLFAVSVLPASRRLREWLLRRIPGMSQVYWSSVLARFAHTTALGAFNGTPLPDLVAAGGAACGSPSLADAATRVRSRLEAGESLQAAARHEPFLPALWTCVVTTAGPRGDLPSALAELARTYEARAEHWVRTMRILLGPILLIGVSAFIAFIVGGMSSTISHLLRSMMGP